MSEGIRERARDALRLELADAICNHFAEHGFAEVTVEEAARAAGVSRATFFRYFESKEDAVLVAVQATSLDYSEALRSLAPEPGETLWRYAHRAVRASVEPLDEQAPHMRARVHMINATPSIRARYAAQRFAHEDAFAEALALRTASDELARTVAAAALAAANLAWRRWSGDDSRRLLETIDACFAQLESACVHAEES